MNRRLDRRARIDRLRRNLIGDSRARERDYRELIKLVREDERDRTMTALRTTREEAASRA